MKRYIVLSLFLAGCKSYQLVNNTAISQTVPGSDTVNYVKLLQGVRHRSHYIVLNNDTAYFERIQKGKPQRFAGFDTLILNKECNCFNGNGMQFILNNGLLTYTKGQIKGTTEYFEVADEKGRKTWELQVNDEYWRASYMKYDSLWRIRAANNISNAELHKDWQRLMNLSLSLHPKEFKGELLKYFSKYSD